MGTLRPHDHAELFARICEQLIAKYGEKGKEAASQAVIIYARERGNRMGQRAAIDGMPLDAGTYAIYGEWTAAPGDMALSFPQYSPKLIMQNDKCPWLTTWEELGTSEEIRCIYCNDVDEAIGTGFSPDFVFKTLSHRSRGEEHCVFELLGGDLSEEKFKKLMERKAKMGTSAMKDFEYHTAHLYWSMKKIAELDLCKNLDEEFEAAVAACRNAADVKAAIEQYKNEDFLHVTDYKKQTF